MVEALPQRGRHAVGKTAEQDGKAVVNSALVCAIGCSLHEQRLNHLPHPPHTTEEERTKFLAGGPPQDVDRIAYLAPCCDAHLVCTWFATNGAKKSRSKTIWISSVFSGRDRARPAVNLTTKLSNSV